MMSQRIPAGADGPQAQSTSSELAIAAEDPRAADSLALLGEMTEFTVRTYPEDAENGILLAQPDQLATGVFVMARLDGKAAGIGAVLPHEPVDGASTMEVKRMYVREEARGRRVAENVLRWLEIMARTRGAQKLVLLCGPRQPSALRLYERCGYSRRGAFGKYHEHKLSIFFEKLL
jgi:putative acetyltransferase